MWWNISDGVKDIAKSMTDHPEDWRQGPYFFSNVKHRDINIWTANGTLYINFDGNKCLNISEKNHIAKAIKKAIALRISQET